MAFTDQLGTTDSKLANIELGIGTNGTPGTVFDRSISESLSFTEGDSGILRTLGLTSSDELDDPALMLLLLSGDEQGGADKLDLSGSYL